MLSLGDENTVIDPVVVEMEAKPMLDGFGAVLAGNIAAGTAGCQNIQDAGEAAARRDHE